MPVSALAIEAEHRRLHVGRKLGRALRPQRVGRIDRRAIERDARLEVPLWAAYSHTVRPPRQNPMMPSRAVSPPCDLAHATVRVEIGQQFGVRLGVDDRQQLGDVGDLGEVDALAEIIVRRDREGAELCQPPRHVLDVFVQAEDLHRHQHHRRIVHAFRGGRNSRAFRHRPTLILASPTVRPSVSVVMTSARTGPGGQRVARGNGGRGGHEAAARKRRGLLSVR